MSRWRIIAKLTIVVILGALIGESVNLDHQKWHRLGRTAFLSHQSQRFDKYIAIPQSPAVLILTSVIMAIFLCCVYEGLVAFADMVRQKNDA
jgi:hypothetical protein